MRCSYQQKQRFSQSIIKKLEIEFIDCDFVSEEEFEAFEETREQYIEDIKEGIIVKN
jgi:hypothetical protein